MEGYWIYAVVPIASHHRCKRKIGSQRVSINCTWPKIDRSGARELALCRRTDIFYFLFLYFSFACRLALTPVFSVPSIDLCASRLICCCCCCWSASIFDAFAYREQLVDDENDFVFITQIVAATIIDVDEVMPTMWMNNNSRRPFCVHHFYGQFDSIFANANFDTNEVVEQVREIVLSAGVIGVFFFFYIGTVICLLRCMSNICYCKLNCLIKCHDWPWVMSILWCCINRKILPE